MRGDVGEGIEFFVAGGQVHVQFGQLFGACHHQLHHQQPQTQGRLDFHDAPGQRACLYRFDKQFERTARRQARAVHPDGHDLVVRVAGPVDGLRRLRPEPQDQVLTQTRDPHGQHAAGHVGDVRACRVVLQQRIGGIHRPRAHVQLGALVQPFGQRIELRVCRCLAHAPPPAHVEKRRAIGLHGIEQGWVAVEKRHQVAVLRGFGNQLLVNGVHPEAVGLLLDVFGGFQLQ